VASRAPWAPARRSLGASAKPSPARPGQLLYLRPLGGNAPPWGRLFASASDGTGARDITPAGLLDVQGAAWSPNGRRIAISAIAQGDHDPEIFVMAADGSALHRVTNNHLSDRQPTWSPDGRRIAFASARTGLFQIYAMRADGVASGGSLTRTTIARRLPGRRTAAGSSPPASSAT
jgi:hypothetical protein